MTWVRPDDSRDPDGRVGKWIYAAVGYAALSTAVVVELAEPRPLPLWTLALVLLAAVWLALLVPLYPKRTRRPVATVAFYLGLLAISAALLTRSGSFAWFTWIGYPFGFALFPARWAVFAVAANALTTVSVQTDLFSRSDVVGRIPEYVLLLWVAAPVIFAGWVAGAESEKRRKAIAELAAANKRLATTMEENAGLHAQLLVQAREAGVSDERARMAREIHDTLAQGLAGIVTHLQAAGRLRDDAAQWTRHVERAHTLAKESLTEARRSVQALRPGQLERSHLPDAVAELATIWSESSGVSANLEVTGDPRPLIPGIEVTLFRVVQEALTNVAKHANASRVGVTLSYLDDVVLLDVRDDGVGFTANRQAAPGEGGGFGVSTMRQRVLGVGGRLAVESAPGDGTSVSAQVPAIPAEETL